MPEIADVLSRLQDCIRTTFFDDTIAVDAETTAADVDGWDSLAHVRLLMHIEREFAVSMTDEAVERVDNVGELARLVRQRIEA